MNADAFVFEVPHADMIRLEVILLEVLKERVMLLRGHGPAAPALRSLVICRHADGRVVVGDPLS